MSLVLRLTSLASLLVLAACATAPGRATGSTQASEEIPSSISGQSAYGLFLAGQSAIDKGQGGDAVDYFAKAESAAGEADTVLVRSHVFTAALLAGDVKQAAQVAPLTDDDMAIRRLALLTVAVDDIASDQAERARSLLAQVGPPYSSAAALLNPLAAAEAGDNEHAITLPVVEGDPVAAFFANLDQAIIFERLGRFDEAETALRALIQRGDPGSLASENLGSFLERRGRWDDAIAIYDQAMSRSPQDPTLLADRARAASHHGAPPIQTLKEAASEALTASASVLATHHEEVGALAYLRLALRLDPNRDLAWLLVGDVLSDVGDKADARVAYQAPRLGSTSYVASRDKLAWSYQGEGQKDEALQIARSAVDAAPASKEAATNLADILRADERYADSVAVLDRLISTEGPTPDWRLLYMRAVDYQESNRWSEAEQDLTRALKERPDEPELLNFLGYSWIDRGEKLHEAMAMVQKAVDTNPRSGAMIDSLGWGYYRLGDYKTAVEKLEQAVAIEAGDPDVNNHLGDAYWRVGRRTEARYQWSRVLSLDPDAKMKAEVEAKLRDGLGPLSTPSSGS